MKGAKFFSMAEWMNNRHLRVFTTEDIEVEIIAFHLNEKKPITAKPLGETTVFTFAEDELTMIEPELVLTDFEKEVAALICEVDIDRVREVSNKLLKLADSQVEKEIENAKKVAYKMGCEDTEERMLSWLPKLENLEITYDTPKRPYVSTDDYLVVPRDHFMVPLRDLCHLPYKKK